uniref:Alpha-carbonic anhydrase domain-containing protein n=1 Tax=Ditylenchus dipsaci TaxID=166011 RepID=A0A915DSX2_9BILA
MKFALDRVLVSPARSILLAVLLSLLVPLQISSEGNSRNGRQTGEVNTYPWTFDNDLFGGPDFWGLVNKEWRMCRVGQMQSPINIDPAKLLFDPHLSKLNIARYPVEASFRNTGQLPVITLLNHLSDSTNISKSPSKQKDHTVNISGGPTTPYSYNLHQVMFHFGQSRTPQLVREGIPGGGGSEHTVDQVRFPAEVQLLAYNSDLYDNFTEAMSQPRGLLAIAVIVDIGETSNTELRRLTVASQSITYKERETRLKKFHPANLLPKTDHYVTYEGSLTYPAEDLSIWNNLQQTKQEKLASFSSSASNNPVYMSFNYRPLKPLNNRLLRTNINVQYKSRTSASTCPSNIYLDMGYRSNPEGQRHWKAGGIVQPNGPLQPLQLQFLKVVVSKDICWMVKQ